MYVCTSLRIFGMNKKCLAIFLLLMIASYSNYAQYTEVINSNRPGQSESPYSVGSGVYQFEAGLFFRKAAAIPTFSNPQALGLNLQFRTSFFDDSLEFNVTTAFQNDTYAFKNIFESSYTKLNFSQFTVAAKYLVYAPNYKKKSLEIRSWKKRHAFGWDRWIPHVGLYAGVNFGNLLGDFHKRGAITPKFGVLLQNELSNELNVVTNLYYNYAWGRLPEWSYIVTATYNFNFHWSGFAEHQALFNKQEKQSNLGVGLAYLFSNDLQFNSVLRTTFQAENTVGIYAGLGASYRIDKHQDKFVELDEYGNPVENIEKESYNKGFFGRMIDKIKNIFKKKDKREIEIDEEIASPTKEEEDTSNGRTRSKSILGDIAKEDEKDKKQTAKEKEKAAKRSVKEKEKAARDLEKEAEKQARDLEKLERDKDKEIEKLEREEAKKDAKLQKELDKIEQELKKEEAKAKQEELDRKYEEELRKRNSGEDKIHGKDDEQEKPPND